MGLLRLSLTDGAAHRHGSPDRDHALPLSLISLHLFFIFPHDIVTTALRSPRILVETSFST